MKLSKSVTAMHEYVEQQNLKKEEKERRKREKKEAAEWEEAEKVRQEEKEARATEKARKCAEEQKKAADAERERRAQMKKDVDISMAPFTPFTRGALERLRYRNKMIDALKALDVVELQKCCKAEGIPYNGKIEAVLDIADVKVLIRFGTTTQGADNVICIEESEDRGGKSDRDARPDEVVA
ncbi:hypothetical protein CBR_g28712 [Chara braunii]|uniref:Uncharacterized protein n=1 Tax=Chara braunii TaxID=69332 RepID=A0A388L9L2_CHABU|nr:hypothetical protein CBR_g28712 [Chara braunii]|eukprot:GBG78999.1 hypothetical protein CBR_g28712 [Chara braunii]